MGYHTREIKKGRYGSISKILEEVEEFQDAEAQRNIIMMLVELSDIYGALEGVLENLDMGITMEDLETMSDATKRAFKDGSRS